METHRIALLAALMATVGWVDPVAAQENTLPPVTADSPNLTGGPGSFDIGAVRGPCPYDGAAVRYRALLNNSVIGAEVLEMSAGKEPRCPSAREIQYRHVAGPWAYMFADGPSYPDRMNLPSLEEVEAIKKASLEAARGDPGRPAAPAVPADDRYQNARHVPVPRIGDGYGTAELRGQTLRLYAAPSAGVKSHRSEPAPQPRRGWEGFNRQFPSFDSDTGSRTSYRTNRTQSLSRTTFSAPRPEVSTPRAPRSPGVGTSPRKVEQEQ